MEFLGIGAPELVFILIIALILLGPRDMQKAGKTIGVWLNNVVRSEWWRAIRRTSEEIRSLPTNLMREANREMMDIERDLHKTVEPPSIGGPRPSATTAPVDPTPAPESVVLPEPPAESPPEAVSPSAEPEVRTGPKPNDPPAQEE